MMGTQVSGKVEAKVICRTLVDETHVRLAARRRMREDEDDEGWGIEAKIVKRPRLVPPHVRREGGGISAQTKSTSASSPDTPEKREVSGSNDATPPRELSPKEERKDGTAMTNPVAAPSIAADRLWAKAWDALHKYQASVKGKEGEERQQKACQKMATAWGEWFESSRESVSILQLERFGNALDSKGRRTLATALQIEDWILDKRIEDRLDRWIGRKEREILPN
ncbi:hypothetical protein FRC17_002734 [Serendipita sp. 399]|nr:hypothetical protein FRC17_002734 [Serendipita sp. 399]